MNIDHRDCDHDATSKARAACRKARAAEASSRATLIQDLIEVFNEKGDRPNQWVWYAARRFASYEGEDLNEAAAAILDHFRPSGDEARDAHRTRNGYIITDSHYHMLQITLRAAS
jgi:hypothetical protein